MLHYRLSDNRKLVASRQRAHIDSRHFENRTKIVRPKKISIVLRAREQVSKRASEQVSAGEPVIEASSVEQLNE